MVAVLPVQHSSHGRQTVLQVVGSVLEEQARIADEY